MIILRTPIGCHLLLHSHTDNVIDKVIYCASHLPQQDLSRPIAGLMASEDPECRVTMS